MRNAARHSRSASGIILRRRLPNFSAKRGIFTWDGNYYALNLTERLQLEQKGRNAAHRPGTLQHAGRGGTPARRPARIRLPMMIRDQTALPEVSNLGLSGWSFIPTTVLRARFRLELSDIPFDGPTGKWVWLARFTYAASLAIRMRLWMRATLAYDPTDGVTTVRELTWKRLPDSMSCWIVGVVCGEQHISPVSKRLFSHK